MTSKHEHWQNLQESLEKKIREQVEFLEKANKPKERKTSNKNKVETSTAPQKYIIVQCFTHWCMSPIKFRGAAYLNWGP